VILLTERPSNDPKVGDFLGNTHLDGFDHHHGQSCVLSPLKVFNIRRGEIWLDLAPVATPERKDLPWLVWTRVRRG